MSVIAIGICGNSGSIVCASTGVRILNKRWGRTSIVAATRTLIRVHILVVVWSSKALFESALSNFITLTFDLWSSGVLRSNKDIR